MIVPFSKAIAPFSEISAPEIVDLTPFSLTTNSTLAVVAKLSPAKLGVMLRSRDFVALTSPSTVTIALMLTSLKTSISNVFSVSALSKPFQSVFTVTVVEPIALASSVPPLQDNISPFATVASKSQAYSFPLKRIYASISNVELRLTRTPSSVTWRILSSGI